MVLSPVLTLVTFSGLGHILYQFLLFPRSCRVKIDIKRVVLLKEVKLVLFPGCKRKELQGMRDDPDHLKSAQG